MRYPSKAMTYVMHLPEFTAVCRLGFAGWIRGQCGSYSSAAYRLRPGAPQPPPKFESELTAPDLHTAGRPSDTHCSGDKRPSGSSTGTVNHWQAQQHPCRGDNRPGGIHLQHAQLWRTPLRHSAPRSMTTTHGLRRPMTNFFPFSDFFRFSTF
jgi:hypothetical protein